MEAYNNYALGILALSVLSHALVLTTPINGVSMLTSILCNVANDVRAVVGIFAFVMFLLGGLLYSAGHFMPAAGNLKSSMQGWAMGMLMGGVIGLILVILAPFIIGTIASFGNGSIAINTC